MEGCLERIGEDDPESEDLLRGDWEEGNREVARVAAELAYVVLRALGVLQANF